MNEIVRIYNEHPVRIVDRDGNPWFVAKDVCDILEIGNSRQVISYLDEDEKSNVTTSDVSSFAVPNRGLCIISEAGLYSLILRSRKPEAKAFKRWVTHEVLPSIRRTGAYVHPNADMGQIATLVARLCDRITALVEDNAAMRADNDYLRQYEPLAAYGSPSPANGLPRWQYRRGAYVSHNGRRPRRPVANQLDLFLDWPALREAKEAAEQFVASCPMPTD